MKGKTFIILGLGAAGGFIGGNIFAFNKMMESNKMRDAFSSILTSKITKLLFDDEFPCAIKSIRYHNYHNETRRIPCYATAGIEFDTRADAEEILERMQELIDMYGYACIQDFYDLCGLSNEYHRECNKRGWFFLSDVEIRKRGEHWFIDMPKTVPVS